MSDSKKVEFCLKPFTRKRPFNFPLFIAVIYVISYCFSIKLFKMLPIRRSPRIDRYFLLIRLVSFFNTYTNQELKYLILFETPSLNSHLQIQGYKHYRLLFQ